MKISLTLTNIACGAIAGYRGELDTLDTLLLTTPIALNTGVTLALYHTTKYWAPANMIKVSAPKIVYTNSIYSLAGYGLGSLLRAGG